MTRRNRPQRRHGVSKAELIARLHRGFRPRLVADQILDLGLVHASNLDAIASGAGTEKLLWDAVAGVLTWSKVAEMLVAAKVIEPDAVDLMAEQIAMTERMVARYGRTGRVAFDGTDYQLAKAGVEVMDQLARIVDRPTAVIAADWSERRVNEMAAEGEKRLRAREAKALPEGRGSQQVLKAEGASPDATDRDALAITSPVGGPMGAEQPAAAGLAWGQAA